MLALLVPGVGMGAGGEAGEAEEFVQSIGRKRGVVRPDGADLNSPTGLSGVSS